MVNRATESALQKNRKAGPAAAGGGAAAPAEKKGDSSGSATPSPEKSVLLAPIGKPKRVRPVSTGSSPATSLVAAGGSVAQAHPVLVVPVPALQSSANASISRPRAKKLLQGSLCFAVCAFDTTVPVPLRSSISDFDALLVAIHNQVRNVALLPFGLSMAISFLLTSLPLFRDLTSNSFFWGSVSPTISSLPLSPLMAKLCTAALPSKPRLHGALLPALY